jgi:hypothetical protein
VGDSKWDIEGTESQEKLMQSLTKAYSRWNVSEGHMVRRYISFRRFGLDWRPVARTGTVREKRQDRNGIDTAG